MMSSAFAIGFVSEFSLFLRPGGTRDFRGAGSPGGRLPPPLFTAGKAKEG